MHEKRFHGNPERLRSPERVARISADRAVELATAGIPGTNAAGTIAGDDGRSSRHVLDIGTGTALFAERFAAAGFEVAGIDADPEMIRIAKGYVPSGDFRHGVAESLPFNDKLFDLVFFGLVFHETDDPVKALKEAARVCRYRIAVLEWPYDGLQMGPPPEHRLKAEQVRGWFEQIGLLGFSEERFENTVLYLGHIA